jgi:hypothetical protein
VKGGVTVAQVLAVVCILELVVAFFAVWRLWIELKGAEGFWKIEADSRKRI